MSGKKGYIVRNQRNKNQLLFLTFILRTFDKNFAQLHQNLGKNSAFIFLGGYKGLLLSKVYGDADPLNGGIYIDRENNLPHGLVKISLERRSDD